MVGLLDAPNYQRSIMDPVRQMDDFSWESLILAGVDACRQHDASQWVLGDLALLVKTHHGERTLERYAQSIGVEHGTLENYGRVARAYEKPMRIGNLSWYHHRLLAARPDRLEWLAKAAEHQWSTHLLQEQTHLADNPPVPKDLPLRMAQKIQDGTPAVDVVTEAVRTYGLLPPSMAREVARLAPVLVPGSDNRMYDARPEEVIERDSERVQRQIGLYQALKHIATRMMSPSDEVATTPRYQEAATTEYLDRAIQWLEDFRSEWRKVHD
mgnify:CR=1 FL=1